MVAGKAPVSLHPTFSSLRGVWLFYTGTSKKFGKGFNPDSKVGIAVQTRRWSLGATRLESGFEEQ